MATRRPPTMLDVARLAGTSKATVSNVMHGHEHVRPETRERVLTAIATLGYKVNMGARSLARQQSNVLGILLGDLENPWYATLAAHIERLARARDYAVLIASTGGEPMRNEGGQVEASRVVHLVEHRVAAIVLLAFSGDPAIQQHVAAGIPLVFVGTHGPGTSVTVDDRLGAHLAVTHLLELGHRNVGYVNRNADGDPLSDDERFASFQQTLEAAGAPAKTANVVRLEGPDTHPVEAIDALLTAPDRPTAIFAASDLSAIEVLDRADALGLRIPEDLSLVGFDDISMARLKRISLTTIAQPALELATKATAAAITLATSEGDGHDLRDDFARHTILTPELVVRGTTRPPRSA